MSHPIGPMDERMMAQFMGSADTNIPFDADDGAADIMAAAICAKEPVIAQALTAAALVYCSGNFDEFAESLNFPPNTRNYAKLVLTAAAVVNGNVAKGIKEMREAGNDSND
jgi:hypothetical protein